jgi:hypothetical protein
MDDIYNSIKVESVDGQQSFEFSGVARDMSLTRFKSLVAMRVHRLSKTYTTAADLDLMVFGEMMTDGGIWYPKSKSSRSNISRSHLGRLWYSRGIYDYCDGPVYRN